MDEQRYSAWIHQHLENPSTQQTALSDVRRIAREYGDLDKFFDEDALEWVLSELEYTASDEREGKPNPSKLQINGDLRKGLASYKSHLKRYIRFRQDIENAAADSNSAPKLAESANLSFRYEQDLQTALVACIDQIEPGMTLAENGKEFQVPSGRIDALVRDSQNLLVVIELKAVTAKRDVLGQIAAYMADIQDETGTRPRGILIAPEFDDKLVSGARMIEGLKLMRYSFSFSFSDI